MTQTFGDAEITLENFVATVEIKRPPHNFFDHNLIRNLADAFEALDDNPDCRALVLCSEGKSFCAGADFSSREDTGKAGTIEANPLYTEAVRLFACKKPIIGAIQGAAIGGGLGLALVPDFRIGCPESRFAANFVKLGIHPGFGLTHTLPRLIGLQNASLLFYTGRRIGGEEALKIGLLDEMVPLAEVRARAIAFAAEIAQGAPLAVQSTRATLRGDLAGAVLAQTNHEFKEQDWLFKTEDHQEGVRAVSERRIGNFKGK
ncbi:MAG: enoyl-CoA hydratase/isomerase family protein [Alphaproteobacteria bacterium]|nr:MAG: enoyl-CoA hydratase/isomerase family protein [Alphaproteobacteria bacterium]